MRTSQPKTPAGPPAEDAADRLQKCVQALVRRFSLAERADVDCHGLTVAQAATLTALHRRPGERRLGELGRQLGISPSTLTRNLVRLEERRLVTKAADPRDGRVTRIRLTRSGRRAATAVVEQDAAFAAAVLAHLPDGTADSVITALQALLRAVRSATEGCCPGAFDHLMTGEPWSDADSPAVSPSRPVTRRAR